MSVVEVDTDDRPGAPRAATSPWTTAGAILNPLLVEGQQHGGLAQGIAQALYEEVVYDPDGQPLTATLADYRMPSAADLLAFETANTETPTPLNPLGAKGIGESATVGSTPAVQNAVVDALSPLGVRHVDLPCTPERVWRAVQDARAGHPADPWREPPAVFATLPVRGGGDGPRRAAHLTPRPGHHPRRSPSARFSASNARPAGQKAPPAGESRVSPAEFRVSARESRFRRHEFPIPRRIGPRYVRPGDADRFFLFVRLVELVTEV